MFHVLLCAPSAPPRAGRARKAIARGAPLAVVRSECGNVLARAGRAVRLVAELARLEQIG